MLPFIFLSFTGWSGKDVCNNRAIVVVGEIKIWLTLASENYAEQIIKLPQMLASLRIYLGRNEPSKFSQHYIR